VNFVAIDFELLTNSFQVPVP